MERIAELERGELRFHGGNFTAYEEAVQAEHEVAEKNIRNAEQELKREKREMQQARERAERRASNAARNLKSAGLPRIFAGNMKRGAQESAGRSGQLHASRVGEARARLDEAGRALRDDQRLTLDLPDTDMPAGRTLVLGEHLQVRHGGQALFAEPGVDLTVRGPERIALNGPNGSGKTTLLRLLNGELGLDGGQIKRSDGRIAYLSQRLDLLDTDRTVAENFTAFAPHTATGAAGCRARSPGACATPPAGWTGWSAAGSASRRSRCVSTAPRSPSPRPAESRRRTRSSRCAGYGCRAG